MFTGFVLAALIAVPLGVLCGLSRTMNAAINPLIQIFKPVSPLAWLPIVTMVVSAVYVSSEPLLQKSFVISAITVTLCSLWPTLINTALGVASIDKDLMNVGRVLQLGWFTKVFKIVLPSALPLIFTGLRLSLGVGWMVLIAAEMLAQNPGLGKFVWDEFQNGSSESLARIMVAVLTIGVIGFLLDRVMLALQAAVHAHGESMSGCAKHEHSKSVEPASAERAPLLQLTASRSRSRRRAQGGSARRHRPHDRWKASSSRSSASPARASRR